MSTRATIWIKTETGHEGIYLHSDGYLSSAGAILLTHYADIDKIKELIQLGDISSLGAKLVPSTYSEHSFSNREDDTVVAYHRDRGDKISMMEIAKDNDFIDCDDEYRYVYDNGWTVTKLNEDTEELTEELILKEWNGIGYINKSFLEQIANNVLNNIKSP